MHARARRGPQNKFQHFEVADTKRYRDLWQMNEEVVTDLMRKVLQADKLIHEQQLGLSWLPPSEQVACTARASMPRPVHAARARTWASC